MSTVSTTNLTTTSSSSNLSASQQVKVAQDLQALSAALKANDLKAAEKAMLQLQIDSKTSSQSGSSSSAQNPLSKVASALASGNLPAAQKEFGAFEDNAAAAYKKSSSSGNAQEASDSQTITSGTTFAVTV